MIEVVLYEPEIPSNTGNIGRLCVSNNLRLHLIEPLGFSLDDKHLKRSGLDYWPHLDLQVHKNWSALISALGAGKNYYLFTTKATKSFWSVKFKPEDVLVFGPETRGLPKSLLDEHKENCLKIPMLGAKHCRSLNLASSASIAVYEALRQLTYKPGASPEND